MAKLSVRPVLRRLEGRHRALSPWMRRCWARLSSALPRSGESKRSRAHARATAQRAIKRRLASVDEQSQRLMPPLSMRGRPSTRDAAG